MLALHNLLTMAPAIAGVSAIVMALLVLCGSSQPSANRLLRWYFAYFSIAMGVWAILISVYVLYPQADMAQWTVRSYYIAAAALVHGFILFCMQLEPKLTKIDTKGLGAAFLFVCLLSFTPDLLLSFTSTNQVILNPTAYALYSFYFIVTYIIAMLMLWMAYRYANTKIKRQQRIALLWAAGIAFPAGGLFNLILPGLGNYGLITIGPLFAFSVVAIVAYAILRHQLFDIRLATVRTFGYAASLVSFICLYFVTAYLVASLIIGQESAQGSLTTPVNILIALILAVFFQPIKSFFDRLSDKVFYHSRYDTGDLVAALGVALTSTVNLRTMLERAAEVLARQLSASSVSIVVHRDKRADLIVTTGYKVGFQTKELEELRNFIAEWDDPIIDIASISSITNNKLLKLLVKKRYQLILPLGTDLGYVLIKERLGGGYSPRDNRVLAALGDTMTIAIQNARSVEEVHMLNRTLQQRIDEATRELRLSNEKLRRLDATKDEFVSMASHQLRTPLTSVKGYISMLLEGDAGKISAQQRQLLSEAFMSSERMVRLIGDFLNVSRLQTGKFAIDPHAVDLAKVIADEIYSIRIMADAHGQTLHYHGPATLPDVMVDEDKTRQVIMNFIDNAIYYSPEGSSIIIKLSAEQGKAVFEVHDQGIGVPKKEQAQLFGKFFRAENARKQRPDGTGVGLFLAKKVIEAQRGEIIFHSRPDMGSVFGFKLPLKK